MPTHPANPAAPANPTPMCQAGLYIHVPFCRRKCAYCDFYSLAREEWVPAYVEALFLEMEQRAGFLPSGAVLDTVYFGGGTPSLLPSEVLADIFRRIEDRFRLMPGAEITIEANPDDITPAYAEALRGLPVNRVSVGVQSFSDRELRRIGRRHTARQAAQAVQTLKATGFDNLSLDLMYGLPLQTLDSFRDSIEQALSLGVTHLSAYMLGLEPHVPLARERDRGEWREAGEDELEACYRLLRERLSQAGFEHYEVSNFCRPGFRSRHNSAYWRGRPYLGLGPGAHSYDGAIRSWNDANLTAYIKGRFGRQQETLGPDEIYDEYVLTRLRTCEGIEVAELEAIAGKRRLDYCLKAAAPYLDNGWLRLENGHLFVPAEHYFTSDGIIRDLMA